MTELLSLILLLLTQPMSLAASDPCCTLENGERGFHWSSPDFGIGHCYPNNFDCSVGAGMEEPQQVRYKFNSFMLQGKRKVNNRRVCVDAVKIRIPYSRQLTFCGRQSGVLRVPNFRFQNTFKSDKWGRNEGFNITILSVKTGCHKVIDLSSCDKTSGVISSPRYPNRYEKYAQCEWWIKAPAGRQVRLRINRLRIKKSKNCLDAYVVVDRAGSRSYSSDTSNLLCGRRKNVIFTSVGEELNVVFDGGRKRDKGLRAFYRVI